VRRSTYGFFDDHFCETGFAVGGEEGKFLGVVETAPCWVDEMRRFKVVSHASKVRKFDKNATYRMNATAAHSL